MNTMHAIVATPAGPDLRSVPVPEPGAKQVLVKVQAAALNRADLGMLRGASHGAAGGEGVPLGLEWAGEIVATGEGVTRWQPGDKVMAAAGGAFAEYALGHEARIYPVPDRLSWEQAATFPVALQTEHDALITHGQMQPGARVLIQGASSGVGLMGMQIARQLGAALVIGTSTSADKLSRLTDFGAHLAINTRDEDWVSQVLDATGGQGVDVLIDHVSGALANTSMQVIRLGGTMVNVGRLGGMHDDFNFDLHALRRIRYLGVTFRTRSGAEVAEIVEKTTRDLLPLLEAGQLRLPVYRQFPLADAIEAFAVMQKNQHFGKLLLIPGQTSS
ncbi:MAG: zinc-binding dehydrogenase [Pseudomonadales bacterium]|nr:zinc-binding dehydrogenase [Pseudomonadales bacterium]